MDNRLEELRDWLRIVFKRDDVTVEPASADASFRRYFRTHQSGQSYIIMDAPPDKENTQPFLRIARVMHDIGLNVPVVLQQNLNQGYFLLSDLGYTQYLSVLTPQNADELYGDAMTSLLILQHDGAYHQSQLPPYDQTLLWNEMQLFRDWYLGRHLRLTLTAAQHAILDKTWQWLAEQALAQPKVFVHRDYHSRNLMYSRGDFGRNPGILDFQDAVQGPITYDLVSLLRDCYVAWPRQQIEDWVTQYYQRASDAGMLPKVSRDQFLAWFDLMGIQRHLKASGIFARLNYRDHKPGYLKDIPRTLNYVLSVAADYPPLHGFVELLQELEIPAHLALAGQATSETSA